MSASAPGWAKHAVFGPLWLLAACNGSPDLGETEPLLPTDTDAAQSTDTDVSASQSQSESESETDSGCVGTIETCDGEDNDCDGSVDEGLLGSAFCTAASCAILLQEDPSLADGTYMLDPESDGVPAEYTCDMTTDGGGWTRVMTVDGAAGQEAAFAAWPVTLSNSTVEDAADHVRWYDGDQTGDVHVLARTVEVPNGGELRLSVDFTLVGPDNSGFFLWLDDAEGIRTPLACQDDTNEGGSVWESWEWDAIPFSCDTGGEDTVEVALAHTTPLKSPVANLGLATFIVDRGGDEAQLYAAELWVR